MSKYLETVLLMVKEKEFNDGCIMPSVPSSACVDYDCNQCIWSGRKKVSHEVIKEMCDEQVS